MRKMMLIDGNSLLFRAYYATAFGGTIMSTSDGIPTNAIFALSNMIRRLIDTCKPDYALVAFDTGKPTFRHNQYSEYKAGRKAAPEELKMQFALARELFELFGFKVYERDGYEADDIIGSMAKIAKKDDFEVLIYTGDRDLLQLIDDNVNVCLTKKGISDTLLLNRQTLAEIYELTPEQVPDFKGLMGDPSDNIPGIPGIGEKTAIKLLKEHGTLEKILAVSHPGKLGEKISSGADIGRLSRGLATIYDDLPLDFTIEETRYDGFKIEQLRAFFIRYEMRSQLTKLSPLANSSPLDHGVNIIKECQYESLTDLEQFDLSSCSCFDVIFSESNPFNGEIIGFLLGNEKYYFIDYQIAISSKKFLAYLHDEKIIKRSYDIKRIMSGLGYRSLNIQGLDFDLLLATYVLDPSVKDNQQAVLKFHGHEIEAFNYKDQNKVIEVSVQLMDVINKSHDLIIKKLIANNLYSLYYDIEIPTAKILSKMEIRGMCLDLKVLDDKKVIVNNQIANLEQEIYKLAGQEFNINSPSQLANILFDVLGLCQNKKRSTAVEFLEALKDSHPIIDHLLFYRRLQKISSNYLTGLQHYIKSDGKLHTIFNQALTQTGRLSSSEPNLQNISVRDEDGREVRKAFIPSNHVNYFLSLDYSQIELRVLASLANEEQLIEAFNNDEDIHARTASTIFKCELKDVSKEMRRRAKVVNFGILYGMSTWGLASEIGVSTFEAKTFISTYFEAFPKIKSYLDETIKNCEQVGYVKTIFGRIRNVPEIHDENHNTREFGKRVAMNTPIQGSAADIMKLAMINIDKALTEGQYETKMLLQIHDELIFEVPPDELMLVIPLISDKMENAYKMKVKMKVEYEYGHNWYEC